MTKEQLEVYNEYMKMDKETLARLLVLLNSNKSYPNIINVPFPNIPYPNITWPYPYIEPYKGLEVWYTTSTNNTYLDN
jgi:hypothetical protein